MGFLITQKYYTKNPVIYDCKVLHLTFKNTSIPQRYQGFAPDHHSQVNSAIKSYKYFGFPVHRNVYIILQSIKCATLLCLKKCIYLNFKILCLKNVNHHLTMQGCHKPSICLKKKLFKTQWKYNNAKHSKMRYACIKILNIFLIRNMDSHHTQEG